MSTTSTRSPSRGRDAPIAWLLISPALGGFAVFFAYPTLRGLHLTGEPVLFFGSGGWAAPTPAGLNVWMSMGDSGPSSRQSA